MRTKSRLLGAFVRTKPGMCRGIWRTKDQMMPMVCEISDCSNQGIGFGHSDSAKVIRPSYSDSAKVIQQLSYSDSAKVIQQLSYLDSASLFGFAHGDSSSPFGFGQGDSASYADSARVDSPILFRLFGRGNSAILFGFGHGVSAVLFGFGHGDSASYSYSAMVIRPPIHIRPSYSDSARFWQGSSTI